MKGINQPSFAGGLACGAALTITASILMGQAAGDDPQPPPRDAVGQYFVTGDTRNGTLWRLEPDGTLSCVSRNWCDAPVYPPADEPRARPRGGEPSVPTGPRVPMGPSVPGGLGDRDNE